MRKQAIVIGLGQFGMALARSLKKLGVEVVGVDRRDELVDLASSFVDEAVSADATNEEALRSLDPAARDLCICAIGNESREGSILVTALLKQMGAPWIVSRAPDELLERILRTVGADLVINPEQAYGERLAPSLIYNRVLDEVPLDEDLVITTLEVPTTLVGRTLVELELPRRYGATIAAVRNVEDGGSVSRPDPARRIREGDVFIVVASPEGVRTLIERW